MSTGAVVAIVVVVLVVAAAVAAYVLVRGGAGTGLKRRFGPEYERALVRHDGDAKATRQELTARVKRYGDLRPRPLGAQAAERYQDRWAALQARFVDEPGPAVGEADRLIGQLAAERGFPGPDSPEHFDALSVHHPNAMQGYRKAHVLAEHADTDSGTRPTEDLRQALVAARELFDSMLHEGGTAADEPTPARSEQAERSGDQARYGAARDDGRTGGPVTSGARDERGTSEEVPDGAAATGSDAEEPSRRTPLTGRFAALTGGTRRGGQSSEHT